MRNTLAWIGSMLLLPVAHATDWSAEQREVIDFLESAPATLATGDLDAYMDLYHPEFTNWYMTLDEAQPYEVVARAIAKNAAGFEIEGFRVVPITVEIDGDRAFVRYVEEELVKQDGAETWRRFPFVALLKRDDERWRFYRTSYFERKTP